MAIASALLAGDGTLSNATSYATASITPTANRLILAVVKSSSGAGAGTENAVPTASGNGFTWVVIASVQSGTANAGTRTTLFRAMGAAPSAGVVTFDFGAQTQTRCSWSIVELSDIDTSGTNGSGAIVQFKTASGTTGTATTADFDNAFGDATNNATYSAVSTRLNEALTEEAGFTELHDFLNDSGHLGAMWRLGEDQTPVQSWTSSGHWAQIIVEIKAAAGGTLFTISPAGSITPTGALSRQTGKAVAGAATPSGTLLRLVAKLAAGTVTAAGSLARTVAKSLTGTITAVGSLAKTAIKSVAGTVTAAGDLTLLKTLVRVFTGTITAVGVLTKTAAKNMAGSITAVGNLATNLIQIVTAPLRRVIATVRKSHTVDTERKNRTIGGRGV